MQKRDHLWIIGCIIVCSVAFLAGRFSARQSQTLNVSGGDVITYSVDGIPTSFNRAWPTYGLPLGEYTRILKGLRKNQIQEIIPFTEGLLDFVVYDAKCRYPLLNGEELARLNKPLLLVSDYRRQFPRLSVDSLNDLRMKKEKEVDEFLLQFRNESEMTNNVPQNR